VDATTWILDHTSDLRVDSTRIAIAGDSAGGNLVTIISAEFPGRIKYAVSIYPGNILPFQTSHSKELNAQAPVLPKETLDWFHRMHVGSLSEEYLKNHPLFTPLSGAKPIPSALPRTHVITAELDPLRDDGIEYVKHLKNSGVPVTHTHYNTVHGFFGITIFPHGREALESVCELIVDNL
jgi:acetyl esterase